MNLEKWKSQIVRGALEYCILLTLDKKIYYGHEILQKLSKYPMLVSTEGTVYPLLRRFKKQRFAICLAGLGRGLAAAKILFLNISGKGISDSHEYRMGKSMKRYV